MSNELTINQSDVPPAIEFFIADEPIITLSADGFFYKGEKIEDVQNVYEKWCLWFNQIAGIKAYKEAYNAGLKKAVEIAERLNTPTSSNELWNKGYKSAWTDIIKAIEAEMEATDE